jgi:hypothetical protein
MYDIHLVVGFTFERDYTASTYQLAIERAKELVREHSERYPDLSRRILARIKSVLRPNQTIVVKIENDFHIEGKIVFSVHTYNIPKIG